MKRFLLILFGYAVSIQAEACTIVRRAGAMEVDVSDSVAHFQDIEKRLKKGLSLIVRHEVLVHGESVHQSSSCKIFYDLWDETYSLTRYIDSHPAPEQFTVKGYAKILEPCFRLSLDGKLPAKVTIRSTYSQVTEEQVEKTKRWLSEKGIGSKSGTVIGRAVDAMIDYERSQVFDRSCEVSNYAN
ncbi:MAG: hypothetical protein AB7T49_18165 [Oligoflexales bacterium]